MVDGKRAKGVAAFAWLLVAAVATTALYSGAAEAAQTTLRWDAPTTNEDGSTLTDLAGYKVYVGTSPGNYQESFDAGSQQSWTVGDLAAGNTYYFAVTAYNTSGEESAYSNEAMREFPADAAAPAGATRFTVLDALVALRSTVGAVRLTPDEAAQYDVAPLGDDGKPHPDGAVDIRDAVAILRNSVGVTLW